MILVLSFRDFLHGPILHVFFVAHLPHPAETTKSNLLVKLILLKFVFLLDKELAVPGAEFQRAAILANEHRVAHRECGVHLVLLVSVSFQFGLLIVVVSIPFF